MSDKEMSDIEKAADKWVTENEGSTYEFLKAPTKLGFHARRLRRAFLAGAAYRDDELRALVDKVGRAVHLRKTAEALGEIRDDEYRRGQSRGMLDIIRILEGSDKTQLSAILNHKESNEQTP